MLKTILFVVCFVILLFAIGVIWNFINPFENIFLHFIWTLSSAGIGWIIGKNIHKIFSWFFNE